MTDFMQALHCLLGNPKDELIQVLYVRLENGKILVFVGAPVDPDEASQVEAVVFGEQLPASLVGFTSRASGTTAQ